MTTDPQRLFGLFRILLPIVATICLRIEEQAQNDKDWQPSRTRVFIVALAEFQNGRLHPFSQDERLDDQLIELFKERGVPAGQIRLLKDRQATSQNIQTEFTNLLSQSVPGEMLFFLFSSHGGYDPKTDRYSFYSYNDKLPFSWAFDEIERRFKGSRVIMAADCCYSGGIVDLAVKRKTPIAYACLSSTYDHQTAWSGWRFIQCLNRGLAGDPSVDLDGNHEVTLEELANYTAHYMAFAAEGKPQFKTTGGFNSQLRLSAAADRKNPRIGELMEAKSGHGWAKAEILDSRHDSFKIHFTRNTKPTNDSWITADAIRPYHFPQFPIDSAVDVQDSGGSWHSARVLERWESLHRCRYDIQKHVPDEWFGPGRIRPALAGTWTGRFENDLGEGGKETLTLQSDEGDWLRGDWSGAAIKVERIGKEVVYFEAQTKNRQYRGAGQLSGERLSIDYCAHRTQGEEGTYHGRSRLQRQGEISDVTAEPHGEIAGHWSGSFENSRAASGAETLDLTENAGQLQGVWSGVAVKGERLGHSRFELTGTLGNRTYRVIGHLVRGELRLDYSASDSNDRYFGWSTLKRRNP